MMWSHFYIRGLHADEQVFQNAREHRIEAPRREIASSYLLAMTKVVDV